MIVTLTLDPGLDLTYTLTESWVGEVDVHRATRATIEASGKGANVSRALHHNGVRTVAVLPLGGSTGHHLSELLDVEGVVHRTVPSVEATRVNITMAVRGRGPVKVNGPGGRLTGSDLEARKHEVATVLSDVTHDGEVWLAVCGSLPPGVGPAVVGELVALAHARDALCALDVSGEALTAAISEGADLVAPNQWELAEVSPRAASAGALVNSVGAGDALLSGWLARVAAPADRMIRALRWARAACLSPMTVAPALTYPPDPADGTTVGSVDCPHVERLTR